MLRTLAALSVATAVAAAPAPLPDPAGFTAPSFAPPSLSERVRSAGGPPVAGLQANRLALAGSPDATSGTLRFVAGLGASLAWDLADLPRHQARLPEPIGGFVPGAGFRAHLARGAAAEGSAIDALTVRWNALYPPYAFEGPAWP